MTQVPLSEQTRWIGKRGGRPGMDVTCLGFGAATISNHHSLYQMTEAQAIDAVYAAHDTGVRYYDTAPWYGRTRSERRLGLALNRYDRASFRLQTKVGRYLNPGQPTDRDSTGTDIINPTGGYPDGGHTTPGSRFVSAQLHEWPCSLPFVVPPRCAFFAFARQRNVRLQGVTHDYSYEAIIDQHSHSLQRLGVSHVDSLVIHDLVSPLPPAA